MKIETIFMLLDAAKRSKSDRVQDEIVDAVLNEIGDDILSNNQRVLVQYVVGETTLTDVQKELVL